MGFISFVIVGLVVAGLARATFPGRLGNSWLPLIAVGVVGGLIGTTVLRPIFGILFPPKILFLAAVVAVAVFGWRAIKGRKNTKRQPTA